MKVFYIYRTKCTDLGETQDMYIGYRNSEKAAQDWIDSQQNQMFSPSAYYIKTVDTRLSEATDAS